MNKYEKEVELQLLEHEKEIREKLKAVYEDAQKEVNEKLEKLLENPDNQSAIMRASYQKSLKSQLATALEKLGDKSVSETTDYLLKTYEDGFLGALYNMHIDGVNLKLMLNEELIEKIISKPIAGYKFSQRLYKNTDKLATSLQAELSRGIATSKSYAEIARQLSQVGEASYKQAIRIVRTEGHRVQSESKMDCAYAAQKKGANVVKQWDSTVDGRTRATHRALDGQIRELDKPFEMNGKEAMYPGGFGSATEDIWCRCALLQRARWALGEEAVKYSRFENDIISIENDTYKGWKNKYLEKTAEIDRRSLVKLKNNNCEDDADI